MLFIIPFSISGTIELEAETAEEACDTVRDWSCSTLLDLAMDVTIDMATPDTIADKIHEERAAMHGALGLTNKEV